MASKKKATRKLKKTKVIKEQEAAQIVDSKHARRVSSFVPGLIGAAGFVAEVPRELIVVRPAGPGAAFIAGAGFAGLPIPGFVLHTVSDVAFCGADEACVRKFGL